MDAILFSFPHTFPSFWRLTLHYLNVFIWKWPSYTYNIKEWKKIRKHNSGMKYITTAIIVGMIIAIIVIMILWFSCAFLQDVALIRVKSLVLEMMDLILWVNLLTDLLHITGVDRGNPVIDVIPSFPSGRLPSRSSNDALYCERVKVSGLSRLEVRSYSSSFLVSLSPSAAIPERLHSKIQVCFHR